MYTEKGICEHHYNGTCTARLNSTEPRYINSSLGLNETEKIAIDLLNYINPIYEAKKKDKTCKKILEATVCFFVFPFCSPDGKKVDYCREDCEYLFKICGDDLNKVSQ